MHTMGIDIGITTVSMVLLDVESVDRVGRSTVAHGAFCRSTSEEHRVRDPERMRRFFSARSAAAGAP